MKAGTRGPGPRPGQTGLGTVELALAGFLGLTLAAGGGMMFRHQVREYLDIREQARIQAGLKLALQAMTLEMANAGALLPNPRESFVAQRSRFAFSYIDLTGRSCPAGAKARITYRTAVSGASDKILQDIACNGRPVRTQTLASVPKGRLKLAFTYYDRRGMATVDPNQVKAVDLDLTLQTGAKAGKSAPKVRGQTIRIQCMNL